MEHVGHRVPPPDHSWWKHTPLQTADCANTAVKDKYVPGSVCHTGTSRQVIYQSLFASSTTDMESFYSCLQKTAKTTVSAWTHEQSHCKRITACMRVYKMHVIIQITLHTSFMKAWSVGFKWMLVSLKAPQRCQQLKWFNWNKHNKPCSFFASYFFFLVQQPIFFF